MLARTARAMRIIAVLAVLVLLAACSTTTSAETGADGSTQDQGQASGATADEFVSTALVAVLDDGEVLFIDQQTEAPYYPTLPEGQVFGTDGERLGDGELASGNVVRVTGNGIMLESYPGQYPGITKVEVTDEGTPESLEPYRTLLAELVVERDPSEPPSATVRWRTDSVTSALFPITCGFTWSFEQGGQTVTTIADAMHPTQIDANDLPGMTVAETTEVSVSFGEPAVSAQVERWSESDISAAAEKAGSIQSVNPDDLASDAVEVTVTDDGTLELVAEPGYRYALTVTFEAGTVTYVFTSGGA